MDRREDSISTPPQSHARPDDFHIKGAAARTQDREHAEPDCCTICLDPITERAVAAPCNHLSFDFICLVQWLHEHSSCPLCKAQVDQVQYDWRAPADFKIFHVAQARDQDAAEAAVRVRSRRRGSGRLQRDQETSLASIEDPALTRRRDVYDHGMFSLHVGSNPLSGYRDITPPEFHASPELQSKARAFLKRELRVFSFLDDGRIRNGRGASRDFLAEYIIAVLKANDVKAADNHAEALISDFLRRDDARLLLHELNAWLRSPFADLATWDLHVQYAAVSGIRTTKRARS